ncbi:GNAT family N-acetyltransferase [Rhizobium sp. LC145]|uniref:GNAT family N-acetyltransferase n=1 Tax=Rhizobium sp. LC145 TaxID=1120688 RepID=UPI001FDAC4EC|nr:GNAT family N-acetyltransferase [Rhizobium sp. LC145]
MAPPIIPTVIGRGEMHKRKTEFVNALGSAQSPEELRAGGRFSLADLSLSVTEDLPSLETAWRRLENLERNSLHQGYDWCRAWFEAHGNRGIVVEGRFDGRTVMLLPLEVAVTFGTRIARPPGGRFNNLNTGLFSEDFPLPDPQALAPLTRLLKLTLASHADLLVYDNVPLEWHGTRHPLAALATAENPNRSFQLPLRASFEETIAQLNAKTRRKKFRLQSRKLGALGGFEHISPATSEEKHALLDVFFRQKGARLKAFGLPDIFRASATRDFFHRLLDAPQQGADTPLVLHAIRLSGRHEGHVAAIAGLSRKGGHMLCQFSSIDESVCPEASPGELLFWLMIEQACGEGATVFDFGLGDQVYKRSWCTEETVQHDILMPLTWKGTAAYPLAVALGRAKSVVKRSPGLYTLLQRCRAGFERLQKNP